jgi:hypothetical protein
MLGMFVTERAIFFVAHSLRMFPFIFGAGVISLLTLLTSQGDNLSGHKLIILLKQSMVELSVNPLNPLNLS